MGKMKTHSGAKKRFKVTGSGKIMRRHNNRSHINRKKPASRLRRLARESEVAPSDRDQVRKQLGI